VSAVTLQGRVLVSGAAGMLGSQLLLTAPEGLEAVGTDLAEAPEGNPPVAHPGVDLCDAAQVEALFDALAPLAGVLHPAAYTAVDRAEEDEELARRVNSDAAENVARAAAARGLPLVLVSTDFVFDGQGERPYRPDDATAPLGVYGRTKWEGEECARAAHPDGLCVRTTQRPSGCAAHFPGTMLRLAAERDELRVVSDQIGSPTSTLELAPALWDALRLGGRGTYHGACEGEASWYDLAAATLELAGSATRVEPCSTAEFPRPAPRPAYSVLDCSSLTALRGRPFKPWRDALADFLSLEGLLRQRSTT